jgi:hypothetical protein
VKKQDMIREMIIPVQNTYILHLPDNMIGKNVEVIAFATDDLAGDKTEISQVGKRTLKQALDFFAKNAVDFNNIEKWNRADLYE